MDLLLMVVPADACSSLTTAACHPQIVHISIRFLESGTTGMKKSSNQVLFLAGKTEALGHRGHIRGG